MDTTIETAPNLLRTYWKEQQRKYYALHKEAINERRRQAYAKKKTYTKYIIDENV
jgi:hypothetical protein